MRDELLFGVAYYPEYLHCDRVEEDLRMMKEAGMNVVRIAESTWSTLEPREGTYDFSYIDRVLEVAKKEEMQVIIGTPTYAIPAWLAKKEPEIMLLDKNGRKKYGHRQLMDIMNPTFRQHAERIIRVLIEYVAEHPTVIGYQIDNETKHYGTVSSYVQELFVEYLKEKFGTTDALNRAFYLNYWSNAIHSWEDFPDMSGCINGGLASEFAVFQRSLAADYLMWQSKLVQEYKSPEQFITHNFDFEWKKFGADIAQDGYSYGVQPDINHYQASSAVTLAGTDIYHPGQDKLTGAEIAFGGDSIRCLKQKNYLVTECQAQAFKYWTPYPGQLRLQAYSHLASGADGIMYWNWHSIHNGYETYWKGVLSHDLAWNPVYGEAGEIGKEWQKIGSQLLHMKKENKIALVVDTHSLDAFKWFPIDRDLSYNDVVRWISDSLYEMNLECDIVDVDALDPQQYQMIITPVLYSASEETIEKLKTFVEQGGVLLSTFKSFVSDCHLSVYHDAQPHGLTECFGMSYNQFTEPVNMTLSECSTADMIQEEQGELATALTKQSMNLKLSEQPVTYFAELLKVKEAQIWAGYQHKYWGSYAGITRNAFGTGKAWYVGCFTTKEVLKEVLRQAAADAGISLPEQQWPIILKNGISPEGGKLHYILHYSQEAAEVACPYANVMDLLTGKMYQKGDKIFLKDWDVVILQEK